MQLPRALVEINSQVSQNTEQLLAITPESIIIKTNGTSIIGGQSIQSVMTDNLASEYHRLQKQLNIHREVAGIEVTQFDQVSIASDLNSVRTEMIHKEFLDILAKRNKANNAGNNREQQLTTINSRPSSRASTRKTDLTESSKPSTVRTGRSQRSKRLKDKKLEEEKLNAELNLLYLEKKQAENELTAIKSEISDR